MRKIVYYLTTSLDGYLARSDGAIDWLLDATEHDFGFRSFFDSVGSVVQGRKTYEQVLTFGEYPYHAKENFVFSKTLDDAHHAEIVSTSVAEFAREQKARPGGIIWLVGGGELARAFFNAQIVDDVIIFVQPILLGNGLSLTGHLDHDVRLRLGATQKLGDGVVRLDYEVAR